MRFEDLKLAPEVINAATTLGWRHPTPLQEKIVPAMLDGDDLRITVHGGFGKTGSYLLPIFHILNSHEENPQVLVIVSKAEEADKVLDQGRRIGEGLEIPCGDLSDDPNLKGGGVTITLADSLLGEGELTEEILSGLSMLVVDGVDSLGADFLGETVPALEKSLPADCRRILLGNDLPESGWEPFKGLLREPSILPPNSGSLYYHEIPVNKKAGLVTALLRGEGFPPALLVTRNPGRADRLNRIVGKQGLKSVRFQRRQKRFLKQKRVEALGQGKINCLIVTEQEMRELRGIPHRTLVWVDRPGSPDRIPSGFLGAGWGDEGLTIHFVTPEEMENLSQLEEQIGTKIERRTCPDLPEIVVSNPDASSDRGRERKADPQRRSERGEPSDSQRRGRRSRKKGRGAGAKGAPATGERRPGTGDRRPGTGDRRPGTGDRRPGTGDRRSSQPSRNSQPQEFQAPKTLFGTSPRPRWNSFSLSLEDSGGKDVQTPDSDPQKSSRKGSQGKRRSAPQGRKGRQDNQESSAHEEPDQDVNEETPKEREDKLQKLMAKRFSSNTKYSSLAGAPPATEE